MDPPLPCENSPPPGLCLMFLVDLNKGWSEWGRQIREVGGRIDFSIISQTGKWGSLAVRLKILFNSKDTVLCYSRVFTISADLAITWTLLYVAFPNACIHVCYARSLLSGFGCLTV